MKRLGQSHALAGLLCKHCTAICHKHRCILREHSMFLIQLQCPYKCLAQALQKGKRENYAQIYKNESVQHADATIEIMMGKLYEKLLSDLKEGITSSPIFSHHIEYLNKPYYAKRRDMPYEETEKNQIVVDYIASMTDDYFIDLYEYLFPGSDKKITYKGYFD